MSPSLGPRILRWPPRFMENLCTPEIRGVSNTNQYVVCSSSSRYVCHVFTQSCLIRPLDSTGVQNIRISLRWYFDWWRQQAPSKFGNCLPIDAVSYIWRIEFSSGSYSVVWWKLFVVLNAAGSIFLDIMSTRWIDLVWFIEMFSNVGCVFNVILLWSYRRTEGL
jgi:hypothetical protein